MRDKPTVAIIGAGFGGIATAVKLKQAGFDTFTVFEQSAGAGGTWWDNRYPGCEVDIPSQAYSFSFMPYDWSRTHAQAPELQQYAEAVIDRFGIRPHFRFGTRVVSVSWDDDHQHYVLRTQAGEEHIFRVVVSALGLLNNPFYPTWPGFDEFEGPVLHTARWDPEIDLQGKRVAVVGTGSTASQLVPAIAPLVEQLYLFQREPGWVLPKGERDFRPDERERFRRYPLLRNLRRALLFYKAGRLNKALQNGSKVQTKLQSFAMSYLDRVIDDDQLRKKVTPTYPYGCKRPVLATTFYPALTSPNVELVHHAVTEVTKTGVVDAVGDQRQVDIIVLATGFQATRLLSTLEVEGSGGENLHDFWGDRPAAFLGITVPRFPNFFILYGPNTNGGWSLLAQLERQAEVAVWAVGRIHRKRLGAIDTRPRALERYVRWIDRQIVKHSSATESGCHNYYHSASGANVTQWPLTHGMYFLLTRLLPPLALEDVPLAPATGSRAPEAPRKVGAPR